jgi:hypothetical protein
MGRIDWHAGFLAAMKLELMEDEDNLEFLEEQFLDGRKQRYDLLIIKNDRSVEIRNEIGTKFDKFNIVEYKNPNDELRAEHFLDIRADICMNGMTMIRFVQMLIP